MQFKCLKWPRNAGWNETDCVSHMKQMYFHGAFWIQSSLRIFLLSYFNQVLSCSSTVLRNPTHLNRVKEKQIYFLCMCVCVCVCATKKSLFCKSVPPLWVNIVRLVLGQGTRATFLARKTAGFSTAPLQLSLGSWALHLKNTAGVINRA